MQQRNPWLCITNTQSKIQCIFCSYLSWFHMSDIQVFLFLKLKCSKVIWKRENKERRTFWNMPALPLVTKPPTIVFHFLSLTGFVLLYTYFVQGLGNTRERNRIHVRQPTPKFFSSCSRSEAFLHNTICITLIKLWMFHTKGTLQYE
jgi:hypothetical protein